jgi:hypothetical protein
VPSGTTVYGSSGPYRVGAEVKVETGPVASKLFLADFLSIAPTIVFGMRRLNSAYAGPLIKVRRASDNGLADIYAGADGWLDEAAVVAHCGASIGTIDTWYDQSGFARNMVQATTARQYQIYDGTAVRKKNTRPAAYVTIEDSGYFAGVPTYTGTQVSGCLVASLTTTAVSGEPAAARFLSLLDTSSNNDVSSTARAILIGRQGGSSPTSNWGTRRSSTWYATAAAAGVDTLDQVVTIYTGSQAQLYRRNGSPVTATSTVAFNIQRLGLGFAGASTYVSCPGAYISEGWFWRDDIDATDRDGAVFGSVGCIRTVVADAAEWPGLSVRPLCADQARHCVRPNLFRAAPRTLCLPAALPLPSGAEGFHRVR